MAFFCYSCVPGFGCWRCKRRFFFFFSVKNVVTRRREEGGEGRRGGGGGRSGGERGHRRRPEGTPQPRLYRARYVNFSARTPPYSTVESCWRERGAGIKGAFAFAFAFAFILIESASCRSRLPLPSSLHPYDVPVFR